MIYTKVLFLINVIPFVEIEVSFGIFFGLDIYTGSNISCDTKDTNL